MDILLHNCCVIFLLFLAMGLTFVVFSWFIHKFIVRPIMDEQRAEMDAKYPGLRTKWEKSDK